MSDPNENDPVRDWLGAYLDGELNPERRSWVESHLAGCAACQDELERLRGLTFLLSAVPLPAGGLAPEEFLAGVMERLPASGSGQSLWARAFHWGLRYAPIFLFVAWAFSQAVAWVTGALVFTVNALPETRPALGGLLGSTDVLTALPYGWLVQIVTGLGFLGPLPSLPDLSVLAWFGPLALFYLGTTALLAVLFLAWLAGIWSNRKAKGLEIED